MSEQPVTALWLHENDIGCLWSDPTGTMRVKGCDLIWHEGDAALLLDREREAVADLRASLAAAYRERAQVVAALFRVGGFRPVVIPAPDAEGWWIVYAETPAGQVSWHIADADLALFDGTGWQALGTYEWDGHTTETKYERVAALTRRLVEGSPEPAEPGEGT